MKRETINLALNGLSDRHIADTAVYSPETVRSAPERIVHMKKKRMISFALAAALILALGISAYAGFGVRSVVSHDMPGSGEYTSLSQLERVEKTVGYEVTVPERFSNGYAFSLLRVRGEAVCDENNEVEKEYYGVHAEYARDGSPVRYLELEPVLGPEQSEPTELRMIGGVPVALSLDHYKIVPEDYRETEEDLAKEAAGHYYVSFGADSVAEYEIASAGFALDGVRYTLMDMAAAADTLDELARMAGELIAAAK